MSYKDYTDDLGLLAHTLAQAELILRSWKQGARGFSLFENSDKTDFMYFYKNDGLLSLNSMIEIRKPVHIPPQRYLIY